MRLIMFNTVMGLAAGVALMLVPRLWAQVCGERMPLLLMGRAAPSAAGWAGTLGVLGTILTSLGFVMTVTHPLAAAKDYIDTIFGEPSLLLGVFLLAAAWYLGRRGEDDSDDGRLHAGRLRAVLAPASWLVFWLGVVLVACTAAIVRFDVVSSAPKAEPITGLLNRYPVVENLFFAIPLYGLAALGCLLFPIAVRGGSRPAWLIVYWSWTVSGFLFAVFSALNFYTHTGMLVNLHDPGPDFRW